MDIARNDPDWYNGLSVHDEPAAVRDVVGDRLPVHNYANHDLLPRFSFAPIDGDIVSYTDRDVNALLVPAASIHTWQDVKFIVRQLIQGGIAALDATELLNLHGYTVVPGPKPVWVRKEDAS